MCNSLNLEMLFKDSISNLPRYIRLFMTLIIPDNKLVTQVTLPCVRQHFDKFSKLDFSSAVSQQEYKDGIDIVRHWYAPWADLSKFKYAYFMGDGITKAIDLTRLEYSSSSWSMLDGDYDWLTGFGKIKKVDRIEELTDQINYITQPFAGNGMLWSQAQLQNINNKIVMDMAYISTTAPGVIELPEQTERVFVGASKSLGAGFLRHGWIFSKRVIPPLELLINNVKYFSSFNFRAGVYLYKHVDPVQQAEQGLKLQKEIVQNNPILEQSDSWLITYSKQTLNPALKRGNVYRVPLGLTINNMTL